MTLANERSETGLISKVAEITPYFWIMKILATTLGDWSRDRSLKTCLIVRRSRHFPSHSEYRRGSGHEER